MREVLQGCAAPGPQVVWAVDAAVISMGQPYGQWALLPSELWAEQPFKFVLGCLLVYHGWVSTRQEATQRAEQIRLGLQQTGVLYAQAVAEHDWQTLGYTSITQWARCEFGPDRFSTERRQEIVSLLTDAGLTVRQIAQATGAGRSTVNRDQAARGVPNGTPAIPPPAQSGDGPEAQFLYGRPNVDTAQAQTTNGQPGQEPNVPAAAPPPTAPAAPPGNPRQQAAREREARRQPAQRRSGGDAQTRNGRSAPSEEHARREKIRLTEAIAAQATRDIAALLSPDSDLGKHLAYLRDNTGLLTQLSRLKLAKALNDLAETATAHHDRILGIDEQVPA